MIDFCELPRDGVRFEQLVRELLIREDYEVRWTGVGPDGGRDLLIIERSDGPLARFERTWLVSCKHFAHSGSSVGRNDLDRSIIDTCKAVNASGFLLACSTQASSGLVNLLIEIEQNHGIICRVFDGVEIEKRLMNPRTFSLLNIFFPKTSETIPWSVQNAGSPCFWCGSYGGHFMYMASRLAAGIPRLQDVQRIVEILSAIKLPIGDEFGQRELLRLRGVYFDDKNENYMVFADYLVPVTHAENGSKVITQTLDAETLLEQLRDGYGLYSDEQSSWYSTSWDVLRIKTDQLSDRFYRDSQSFYKPFMSSFRTGSPRTGSASSYDWNFTSWSD